MFDTSVFETDRHCAPSEPAGRPQALAQAPPQTAGAHAEASPGSRRQRRQFRANPFAREKACPPPGTGPAPIARPKRFGRALSALSAAASRGSGVARGAVCGRCLRCLRQGPCGLRHCLCCLRRRPVLPALAAKRQGANSALAQFPANPLIGRAHQSEHPCNLVDRSDPHEIDLVKALPRCSTPWWSTAPCDSAFSTAITNNESLRRRGALRKQPPRWPHARTEEYSGRARGTERRRGGGKGGKPAGEAAEYTTNASASGGHRACARPRALGFGHYGQTEFTAPRSVQYQAPRATRGARSAQRSRRTVSAVSVRAFPVVPCERYLHASDVRETIGLREKRATRSRSGRWHRARIGCAASRGAEGSDLAIGDGVHPGASGAGIDAAAAINEVVARARIDDVIAISTKDEVVAISTRDLVAPSAARDEIVTAQAVDDVIPAQAEDAIAAAGSGQRIGMVGPNDHVGSHRAAGSVVGKHCGDYLLFRRADVAGAINGGPSYRRWSQGELCRSVIRCDHWSATRIHCDGATNLRIGTRRNGDRRGNESEVRRRSADDFGSSGYQAGRVAGGPCHRRLADVRTAGASLVTVVSAQRSTALAAPISGATQENIVAVGGTLSIGLNVCMTVTDVWLTPWELFPFTLRSVIVLSPTGKSAVTTAHFKQHSWLGGHVVPRNLQGPTLRVGGCASVKRNVTGTRCQVALHCLGRTGMIDWSYRRKYAFQAGKDLAPPPEMLTAMDHVLLNGSYVPVRSSVAATAKL